MIDGAVWALLGIEPTVDRDCIRRAYARKLKVTNPEDDPAAFQHLREAYETALEAAEFRIAVKIRPADDALDPALPRAVTPRPQTAQPTPAPEGSDLPQSLIDLRDDYRRWSELVGREDPGVNALQLFEKICTSPALESVSLRLEFESAVAVLLLSHMPGSGELMLRATATFGWSEQRSRIGTPSAIGTAAKCADDFAYLRRLRTGTHPLSGAFVALTKPPRPCLLRARIVHSGLDKQVRQLLQTLRFERESTLVALNQDALEWWDRYLEKPRLSRVMVVGCLIIPIAVGCMRGLLNESVQDAGAPAAVAFLAMLVATAGKLYVVDWGRIRFRNRFAPNISTAGQIGWSPLSILSALAAGYGPALIPVSAVCVLWAWYTCPDPSPAEPRLTLPSLAFFNVPMTIWIILLGIALPWPTTLVLAGTAVAHIAGDVTLTRYWSDLSPAVRVRAVAALLIATLLVGTLLVWHAQHKQLYGILAALTLAVVLLTRTATLVLAPRQLQRRAHFTWYALPGAYVGLANLDAVGIAVVLTSAWYLFSAAIGLIMALKDEAKRAGLSARDFRKARP